MKLYYEQGGIAIYQGDCRAVMAALPEGSIEAIITDPPYGTEVARDGYRRREHFGVNDRIEGDADLSALSGMLDVAGRVLRNHAWLTVFCSPKRHAEVASLLETKGFPIRGEVVWDKGSPGLGGGIRYQHELILLATKGNPSGRSSLFSVIREHLPRKGRGERHPHEKPVRLMAKIIRYCTDEGQTVLDPFLGSGPTLAACIKSGRQGIGIETDIRYLPLSEERLRAAEMPLLETSGTLIR